MIGRDLLRELAGQLHEMIELRLEAASARRDRPQLDDKVVNFGFRDVRVDHVPSGPARPRVKTQDLTAPRRNHAIDLGRGLGRHGNLHGHDGLEQHGRAFRHAFDHRKASGHAECHLRQIDRMIGAVLQAHRHVHDRKAQRAAREIVAHACLHRGEVVARDGATRDHLGEGKAVAARLRLDLHHHVAELSVSAALLLVPAADLDAFADCLLVADIALLGFGLDAEAAIEALQRDADVHLALAPKNHLVRNRDPE